MHNLGLPKHLSQLQAQGVVLGEPIAQFEMGPLKNFIYLIIDWSLKECAIVDTQSDYAPIREVMQKYQLKLSAVLLTHTHHDHVAGLSEFMEAHANLPIYLHEKDLHRIASKVHDSKSIKLMNDGETFSVGNYKVKALHTPGHSAGELTYALDTGEKGSYLFTGDTVFIRDCGRTDFADGNNEHMFQSLQKVKAFPPETIILCGHHYQKECATTVGKELLESPPFKCKSVSELAALP